MASKTELLRFLDNRVFNPILKARKEDYTTSEQPALADVQKATRSEQQRFREYRGAAGVRENYLSDLHSDTAKRINRELKRLRLPGLPDVKDEFLELAGGQGRARGGKTRTAGG